MYPDLTFANREATCFVEIQADKLTDTISATMELWQGTTKINEWSDSGTLYLSMEETATAKRYRTYSLVINYSINGVSKTPVTISRYYS